MPLSPWEAWTDPPLAPWTATSVPHCFNSYDGCDPDTPAYRGKGWYRCHLTLANPYPNGRTLLHFEGAGQASEIYIDNALAGRHIGGYDEFVLDITGHAAKTSTGDKKGTRLSVLCDNSPDPDRMPSDLSDFTLYGGLYRNVHLVYVPAVSLEMVHTIVDAGPDRPAQIKVQARVFNPTHATAPVKVTIVVTDPSGTEIHRSINRQDMWTGEKELAAIAIDQPELWSPKSPQLYTCHVTLTNGADESTQSNRFGIRFYEFADHGPFLLNGERLLIQGTHRHQDHAGYAAAMPEPLIREEMQLVKEMGANFIRLAHYQQQQLVLDLCDELGIMVWEELSWCRAGVGDQAFRQQGREKLATMIHQHRNHPSIILWGLGNEDDWEGEYPSVDKPAIQDYMQQLNTLAHSLDPTRLTSYRRCEWAREVPDVYSPSIWAGWYGGRFVDYEASLTAQHQKTKKMLHVEWGADNHAGRHAEDPYKLLSAVKDGDTAERGQAYLLEGGTPRVSRDGDWSETYACDLFDWHLKVQQSLPWLTGAVHWTIKDFTTPLRPENPVPRINQKGVLSRDMTRKEGFYVFQSYWAEKPMAHIYGHTWPVRWGAPNQPRTVKVYSNCPTAELFVNGVSAGKRTRDIQNFPAAGLRWQIPFAAGENKLRVVATTATGATITDELTFTYQTRPWSKPAKLALRTVEQSEGKTTIEATLVDANGVLCLDARNLVRFSLAGDGNLIDNRGTSTGSRAVQLCNGRARITLTQGKSQCTAAVAADGIPTAFCNV